MKGISILIPAMLLLVLASVFISLFYFQKTISIERGVFREKLNLNANRIETTSSLVTQAAELSLLQSIYDIGNSNVAISNNFDYNSQEKLPYWSQMQENYLEQSITELAGIYFSKYHSEFSDYFMNPSRSEGRSEFWKVEWSKNMIFEKMDQNEIIVSFGAYNISYKDNNVELSKKYELKARIKTSFGLFIQKGNQAIQMINNGRASDVSSLSDNYVDVRLEDRNNYYIIIIEEKKTNSFYDMSANQKIKDKIRLKFVVSKDNRCLCLDSCGNSCWVSFGQNFFECPNSCQSIVQSNPLSNCPIISTCNGVQVDLCSDRQNCGVCGNECEGPIDGGYCCSQGRCTDNTGTSCSYTPAPSSMCYCSSSLCMQPCWIGYRNIIECPSNYCGASTSIGSKLNQLSDVNNYGNIYVLRPGQKTDFIFT
ncbi:MAG: hypothetical protein QXM68_03510 [Candidatus Aenigmatarchaeota archaeon]|nr:hypothetical protein [Candidatus Aenigmarchaeota archaeon]